MLPKESSPLGHDTAAVDVLEVALNRRLDQRVINSSMRPDTDDAVFAWEEA